jgi:hypothetical protein
MPENQRHQPKHTATRIGLPEAVEAMGNFLRSAHRGR